MNTWRTAPMIVTLAALAGCASEVDTSDVAGVPPTSEATDGADGFGGVDRGFSVHLPARADQPFTLRNHRLRAELSVRLDGASAVERSVEEGASRYADALGVGHDLVLVEADDGVEDWVRLAQPGRVAYRVALGPTIAGLRSLGDSVEFLDEAGTPVLRAARAVAIDAAGEHAELTFTVEGCEVDADPRMPWGRPVRAPGARECVLAVEVPSSMRGPVWVDPLWTITGNLTVARWGLRLGVFEAGAATRVLSVGGRNGTFGNIPSAVTEVYDLTTGTWASVAPYPTTIARGKLVTLADGRLLMTGGDTTSGGPDAVTNVRVFDAVTSTWVSVASMNVPRRRHTATLLADGRVLVAGGQQGNNSIAGAEVYDPVLDTWTPTGNLQELRAEAEAVRLPDGTVLVTSGYSQSVVSHPSSELWDPTANGGVGAFEPAVPMLGGSYGHNIALWGTDRVLVMGGEASASGMLQQFDQVYDIATKSWAQIFPGSGRSYGGSASLPNGSVVIFGGCLFYDPAPGEVPPPCALPVSSTRVYPAGGDAAVNLNFHPLAEARGKFGWTSLPDGRVIVAGGDKPGVSSRTDLFTLYSQGDACMLDVECATGFCVDERCCDTACAGTCEACDSAGAVGTCTAFAPGTDPEDECLDDGAACGQTGACGVGACELHGASDCELSPCTVGEECASGFCADGVCCDTACTETCGGCVEALTGQPDGACHPVLRATDPEGECVDGVSGTCASQLLCDGSFQCIAAASLCAPYACTDQGCHEACDDDDQCDDTHLCIAGECIAEELLCQDDTLSLGSDGQLTDCSPFRCRAEGGCHTVCESIAECAPGLVCDDEIATCVEPPASSGGDAGCACATSRRHADGHGEGASAFGLLLASLALRRRRASRRAHMERSP